MYITYLKTKESQPPFFDKIWLYIIVSTKNNKEFTILLTTLRSDVLKCIGVRLDSGVKYTDDVSESPWLVSNDDNDDDDVDNGLDLQYLVSKEWLPSFAVLLACEIIRNTDQLLL